MPLIGAQRLESLERLSPSLFLIAGGFFLINAVTLVAGIIVESERMITLLSETFNGAGWALAVVALLGFYPRLADRSRWLSRIGAISATFGIVVFTLVSGLSLAFYLRMIEGSIQTLVPLLLPGVFIGGVLSFLLFGIATLRTDIYPRAIGILLLLPAIVILSVFIIGPFLDLGTDFLLLGFVSGLMVVMFATGIRLRSSSPTTHRRR